MIEIKWTSPPPRFFRMNSDAAIGSSKVDIGAMLFVILMARPCWLWKSYNFSLVLWSLPNAQVLTLYEGIAKILEVDIYLLRVKTNSWILWGLWWTILDIVMRFSISWILYMFYIVVVLFKASILLKVTTIFVAHVLASVPKEIGCSQFGLKTIPICGILIVVFLSYIYFTCIKKNSHGPNHCCHFH